MSDITIKNLQDAQAFFAQLKEKEVKKTLLSISLSFDDAITNLDDLHEYEERKLVELINTQVNFNIVKETIKEAIGELESKKSRLLSHTELCVTRLDHVEVMSSHQPF